MEDIKNQKSELCEFIENKMSNDDICLSINKKLENEDEISDNRNKSLHWTFLIEKNAKSIGEKSQGYKLMHIQESLYKHKIYNILMYTAIILGPLSGLISSLGSSIHHDSPTIFSILSTCIAFSSGIFVAVSKVGKFNEKSNSHKIAASKYTSLESNVRRKLSLPRIIRVKPREFLNWVGASYDDLFLGSPLVSKKTYDKYILGAKTNGISIPDEYGDTILIDENYEDIQIDEMACKKKIEINNSPISNKNELISIKIEGNDVEDENKKRIVKRGSEYIPYPQLNEYGDPRMKYELKRMMNL
jgi:hypothetical protein